MQPNLREETVPVSFPFPPMFNKSIVMPDPVTLFPSTLFYRVAWNTQHTTLFRNDMDYTVSSTVWTRPLTQQTAHTSVRYSRYSILNKSIVMPDPHSGPLILCKDHRSWSVKRISQARKHDRLRTTNRPARQARTPSTMLRGPLVGTTRVNFNPALANIAANSFFVRSRPPMMSI